METTSNVGRRLSRMAWLMPDAVAVVEPTADYDAQHHRCYRHVTFRQLDDDSDRIARGLNDLGAVPGTRLALLVRPGIDFISLAFAMYKAGTVMILIDPGMGRRSLIGCLEAAEPEGFVAIPAAQAIRRLLGRRFPKARFNVTVGRRWPFFGDGVTLAQLRDPAFIADRVPLLACPAVPEKQFRKTLLDKPAVAHSDIETQVEAASERPHFPGDDVSPDDPAAIIFTTGSTGPPKGVLFSHRNFSAQVDQIQEFYGIQPGEIDLPCFPMFGLFNCAMGVTAVMPDMNPSRPARVDPKKIIEAARDWNVTQAFGSPAVWDRVGRYCETHGVRLPTIRRVLSAGAPIPVEVLRRMKACIHADGEVHTPYGATEALPVASNSAGEVLGETAAQTELGAGVCVGRRFSGILWRVIRIVDGPIRSIEEIEELPSGEIGELIVQGPQVTRAYVTRIESNVLAKIADGPAIWHRMGDSGYLDPKDRFWFCGRVAHRVLSSDGPLYPICCEAIFNRHPAIRRSALVGVGPAGRQCPAIVVEPHRDRRPRGAKQRERLLDEIRRLGASNPLTAGISHFLLHPGFPVDIRHNAKIFREKLAVWASRRL